MVEQVAVAIRRVLHLVDEMSDLIHVELVQLRELGQLVRLVLMVGERMERCLHVASYENA